MANGSLMGDLGLVESASSRQTLHKFGELLTSSLLSGLLSELLDLQQCNGSCGVRNGRITGTVHLAWFRYTCLCFFVLFFIKCAYYNKRNYMITGMRLCSLPGPCACAIRPMVQSSRTPQNGMAC